MLIIISPSKGQDFNKESINTSYSTPSFIKKSDELIKELKKLDSKEISELMNISDNLAELNFTRFKNFDTPFTPDNAKPAILAFKGDVYTGFNLDQYSNTDFQFAQKHLRIISGLYGILKPLDLIQAYRLEMKTKLANKKGKDLYAFWKTILTDRINTDLKENEDKVLVNLASNEYSKALDFKKLDIKVITPIFKEKKENGFKIVAIFAKKARGKMSNFIIKNKIKTLDELKTFDSNGYLFNPDLSTETNFVFTR